MKRMIAALAAILLLLPLGQAFASGAGSRQDPLISRSYVRRWEELLLADRAAQAKRKAISDTDKQQHAERHPAGCLFT